MSFIDFLAHLVERPIFNQNVVGSSPAKIKCYSHFYILPFLWIVRYNWLRCRPVTSVLRVRIPYVPQVSSHNVEILRILAHLV